MKNVTEKPKITALVSLLVFCLFAVCILGVLLAGARSYRQMTDRGDAAYNARTIAGYLTMRVHQADRQGAVRVEDFSGVSALVLEETVAGKTYLTRIYCCDGFIRELYGQEDGNFSPEAGEKLLPAEALSFELVGNLLKADITHADGSREQLILLLRSEGGVL